MKRRPRPTSSADLASEPRLVRKVIWLVMMAEREVAVRAGADRSSENFERASGSSHQPRRHQQQTELPYEVCRLVDLCKREMGAVEVWLFGSRARGDFNDGSNFDILAVIPDDAPADVNTPIVAFRLRRRSAAHADLFTVQISDFLATRSILNTLCYAVVREGIRRDI